MTFRTNPNFWDCNCESDYIHPKRQVYCGKCHTAQVGQPDSRQNEIEQMKAQKRFNQSAIVNQQS